MSSGSGDGLTPFLFEHAAVRGGIVRLHDTRAAILAAHDYPPAVARALGELLAASALLASTLKLDGSLVAQLRGGGPLRLLVVECTGALDLRGTAQWSTAAVEALGAQATLQELAGEASAARLAITLDPRGAGRLYQGIVALEGQSVAASIEHYLATSEQLPSRLVLAMQGTSAAGLLLQRLPGSTRGDEATWNRVTATLDRAEALLADDTEPTAVLRTLFAHDDVRVLPVRPARFACKCSLERAQNALRIAGSGEVEAALAEAGVVEVTCEYCGRRYTFDPDHARALFAPRHDTRH
jgi:molecular chaperone Hsp33